MQSEVEAKAKTGCPLTALPWRRHGPAMRILSCPEHGWWLARRMSRTTRSADGLGMAGAMPGSFCNGLSGVEAFHKPEEVHF
jgi:hypothetical protein